MSLNDELKVQDQITQDRNSYWQRSSQVTEWVIGIIFLAILFGVSSLILLPFGDYVPESISPSVSIGITWVVGAYLYDRLTKQIVKLNQDVRDLKAEIEAADLLLKHRIDRLIVNLDRSSDKE